jgi:hypothetical protein
MTHPATRIVAYFDDINVVSPAAAAANAFEALSIEVRTAGLTPVASKSAAYSSDQDIAAAAAAAAAELGGLYARDGLVIAGTPIGTDLFVRDFLSRKRQEVRDKIQHLVDFPPPLAFQDKWVILSRSLQLRLLTSPAQFHGLLQDRTSNNMLQISAKLPSRSSANPTPERQGRTLRPPISRSISCCARGASV